VNYVSPAITYDAGSPLVTTYDAGPTIPFDSPFWVSASETPAVFETDHIVKTLSGTPGTSTFTTGDWGDEDQETSVDQVKLRFKQSPTSATCTGYVKAELGATMVTASATATLDDGGFDLRQTDQWHRFAFSLTGSAEFVAAIRPHLIPAGGQGDLLSRTNQERESVNAFTAYLRANFTDVDYDYTGVTLIIPPGIYSVSSWDLTSLLIQNVHIDAHGAVLVARTAGKHVVDCIGSRYIKFHGLTIYSGSSVVAKSGIQIGPKGTEAIGNFAFNDVNVLGYYDKAPYLNLGAETTVLDNTRFIQRNTDSAAYAQICDGLSTFLPTSDYATITRSAGQALSFTANNYHSCQIRNEGGGSASYLAKTQGWEFDKPCYHLSFNASAFVVYGTATYRSDKLAIRGSFESNQNDNPTAGNIGIRYAVTFDNDGTNTAIDGFTFESSNMHAETFVFRNAGAGSCRLSDADIRVHGMDQAGALMFGTSGTISVDGLLMTQASSKTNLGVLSAFNGAAVVDDYASLVSVPAAGSYSIHSRTGSATYHGGTHEFTPFTFTPTMTFATPGDLSVTYSVQSGWGYRIGKNVYFQLALTFTPTHTTASGEFRIAGLPYTSANGTNQESGLPVTNINSAWTWPASVTQLAGRLPANASNIRLYGHGSGIASTVFATANLLIPISDGFPLYSLKP
jgi:hypothetical protein